MPEANPLKGEPIPNLDELARRIDPEASRKYQDRFAELMDEIVPMAALLQPTREELPALPPPRAPAAATNHPTPAAVRAGSVVEAVIVKDPKNKNRLFARHEATGLEGNMLNGEAVPAEPRELGTRVRLEAANVNLVGRQIAFRWPKS